MPAWQKAEVAAEKLTSLSFRISRGLQRMLKNPVFVKGTASAVP